MSDPVVGGGPGGPDSLRIRANVQKMLDGGAKRAEIDRYLTQYEGAQPTGDAQTGDIDLSKGQPVVTVGNPVGVGVDAETLARAKSGELGLPAAIQATVRMDQASATHAPKQMAALGRDVRKRTAPGLASTAANVALSHLIDPLSNQAGEAATDEAVQRYLDGGQGVSPLAANTLGLAAFGGNVAGNVGVGKVIGAGAKGVGAIAGEVAPRVGQVLNASRAGRLASHAISGATANASLAAAGSTLEGNDLPETGRRALSAGAQGAVAGGILGALVEAPGLSRAAKELAGRMFAPAEDVRPAVRDQYLKTLSPADRTYVMNEPQLRDAIFPELRPKPGPGPFPDDGTPPEPPHGTLTQPTTPEPPPQGGSPVSPPQMNEAGFYGDHGNATVAVEPGTKIEGDGALDTVTAVKQAVAKVGPAEFRRQADAEIAKRGADGDIDASKAAVEQVARTIATGKDAGPKEPWQMTRDEWYREFSAKDPQFVGSSNGQNSTQKGSPNATLGRIAHKTRMKMGLADRFDEDTREMVPPRHKEVVAEAVRQGLPVPPDVLAEYPDLAPSTQMDTRPSKLTSEPEKVDLFGNVEAPKVEQPSMFAEGTGTKLAQDEAKKLARKDQSISADEMAQRRDELGAPKSTIQTGPDQRAFPQHESARDPSGKIRPLHRVSTEGLVREYGQQVGKMPGYDQRRTYNYTTDDNLHSTEDGRTVISASRKGAGKATDQAKAQRNVEQAHDVLTKIEAELAKRGEPSTPGEIMQGHEALTERDAEREGMAALASGEQDANDFQFEYRHSLFGLDPATRQMIKTGYRSAMVTPYADAEVEAPELVAALHKGGASMARATHIASRRTALVLEGLSPEQKTAFGQQLRYDNLVAARDAATDPQIKQNFDAQAATAQQTVPPGTDEQPWFQSALAKHKQYIEQPLQEAALQAGVDPNSLRQPKSGYMRLVSEDRLQNSETRRAMDATNSAHPDDVQPRGRFTRALIGERPEVQRLFPKGTEGLRQGVLPKNAGYPGEGVPNRKGTTQTGSAKQAQGTAREYASDYVRVIAEDARDKAVRAARNNVYAEVAKIGKPLGEKEAPALGKTVIAFDDSKGIATGGTGSQRFEVSRQVRDAVTRFHQTLEAKPQTSAASAFKKISGGLTQAQLSGMPVEATSHANTVASIVASVPGEKDAIGKGLTLALPGLGAKAAAIREMGNIDFTAPDIRALEMRLADIGALRVEEPRGGLLNTAHHWLFGPEGVDTRGRLVLARKYLARDPNATDEALREFVTSKLGNYVSQNSGALPNALQGSGVTAFARFQAARIPGSIRATFGSSGLPATSTGQLVGDIANTLYRGPVGHVIGTNAVNYALTGHSTFDNEKGHALDVDLNTTVGPDNRPLFVPGATINPVVATGLRASGAKALFMSPRDGEAGRISDAVRDISNQGLASLSPAARFAITAATGRSPYLVGDNSFLKVVSSQPDRDKQLGAQLEAAVGQANPALHAFAAEGGDLTGHSLAGALSEDGKLFGGPKATAARVGEFLMPRILTSGVGGANQELSATMIMQRDYQAALQDATREVQHAAGPKDAQAVADKWVQRFRDAGFNTLPVEAAFRKAMNMPDYAREARAGAAVQKFRNKNIGPLTQ